MTIEIDPGDIATGEVLRNDMVIPATNVGHALGVVYQTAAVITQGILGSMAGDTARISVTATYTGAEVELPVPAGVGHHHH